MIGRSMKPAPNPMTSITSAMMSVLPCAMIVYSRQSFSINLLSLLRYRRTEHSVF